ncbi:MAG: tRNA uridine-5-carboxymethylaminomethyl(34) synthesis GTPase MnmE [Oscillospiraceae bacterium]|jgi:tRNA modification GTPase|nr:tRNA uridine-5-carboxymethylaminomethyl(34) synthesis GTPase MnmE [Oscillospiraceae bacterium]
MTGAGDTIAAIATGGGVSAVGIIRLSGPRSIEIADRVFRAFNSVRMSDAADRRLCYGELFGADGGVADICLCTVSRGPGSYTGEDTAEMQCHGSPAALAEGLRAVFAAGARQALAGEFTKRAFLNGRMDLSQAEAVIDLIEAQTAEAAKNAAGQLAGAVRTKIEGIYGGLLDVIAHFFAVIDYPDEDIDAFEAESYAALLDGARRELERLLSSFERGRVVKEGVVSAIIGRPNVGKSSLLNALAGYERAIVAESAGTTRDTIEERVSVGGVLLRLIDTAGIRAALDDVELQGIARARAAARGARLVIAVFDGSQELTEADRDIAALAVAAERSVAVINKSDLPQRFDAAAPESGFGAVCRVSALTGEGLDSFGDAVASLFPEGMPAPQGEIITNERQAEAIGRAAAAIEAAAGALSAGVTHDAALSELEAALAALGEITGVTVREDLVSRIFERFCVGK